jgi:rhomboid protease GluP
MKKYDDLHTYTLFEEEIPEIDDSMLHRELVDFEARMPAIPILSLVIGLACVVAFAAEESQGALANVNGLVRIGALEKTRVHGGEYWRMLSSAFLHGSADHLIGNMLMLYVLGMACEHAFGRPQFLFLYVGAGLAGASLSLLGKLPSVGASGAIFGLAGAIIVLFTRHRHRLHLRDHRIGVVLGCWALYQLVLGMLNPAVDNRAHLGGLLGGMALGWVLKPAVLDETGSVSRSWNAMALLAIAILAMAYCCFHFVPLLAGG